MTMFRNWRERRLSRARISITRSLFLAYRDFLNALVLRLEIERLPSKESGAAS